jgi:hypothetical protein
MQFDKKKFEKIREDIFGKPTFNLEIKLQIHERQIMPDDIDLIEKLGLTIYYAKKLFDRNMYVTDKGYIFGGFEAGKTKTAMLNIDKQISIINLIYKAIQEGIKDPRMPITKQRPFLRIYCDNKIHYIKLKDGSLYYK